MPNETLPQTANLPQEFSKTLTRRFWAKVNKNGPIPPQQPELGPCWLWTGAKFKSGYGAISRGGRDGPEYSHRVSYLLEFGDFNRTLCVCHKCDNRPCVNPGHLFIGSHFDNTNDAKEKGRLKNPPTQRGENHPKAILNEEQVIEIRSRTESSRVLAAEYGVCKSTIKWVRSRGSWKHI